MQHIFCLLVFVFLIGTNMPMYKNLTFSLHTTVAVSHMLEKQNVTLTSCANFTVLQFICSVYLCYVRTSWISVLFND